MVKLKRFFSRFALSKAKLSSLHESVGLSLLSNVNVKSRNPIRFCTPEL